MMIEIQLGPDFAAAVADLSSTGRRLIRAADKGLALGSKYVSTIIASTYLQGQALKHRSGNLARALDGWRTGLLESMIGVREGSAVEKYKWLLGDEDKWILPTKGHRFLTIPTGENVQASGQAKYTSPWQVPTGFFIKVGGRYLFGYKRGKVGGKGKFRALFTLVTSVLVQGTGALYDGVEENVDKISDTIQAQVDKAVGPTTELNPFYKG
jgi:hypothetical protein